MIPGGLVLWEEMRPRGVIGCSEDGEEPAHLNERVTPGRLDRGDGFGGSPNVIIESKLRRSSIELHLLDTANYQGLEISGDPCALGHDGGTGAPLALPAQLHCPLLKVCGDRTSPTLGPTREPSESYVEEVELCGHREADSEWVYCNVVDDELRSQGDNREDQTAALAYGVRED